MTTHQRLSKLNSFTIKSRETILSREYKFKYLGVMLDPCLTWNYHIDYITTKILSWLGICCGRLGRSFLGGYVSHCMSLWSYLTVPPFDYYSTVWDRCGNMNSDYLDMLQRRAVSIIEGRKVQQCDVNLTLSSPSLDAIRLSPGLQVSKWPGTYSTVLIYYKNLSSPVTSTPIIRDIKIRFACLWQKPLNTKAHLDTTEQRHGTHYILPEKRNKFYQI